LGYVIARYFPIQSIRSEYTGTIKKIDTKKGTITICHDKKPYQIYAQCYGTVENISDNLRDIEGKNVLLKPFTQIRAGATRPVVHLF